MELDMSMEDEAGPISDDCAPEAPVARAEESPANGSGSSSAEIVDEPLEKGTTRSSHWHTGEILAAFLSFEAARRQKSTSTKLYRAEFAASCYPKFAKQMKTEGKLDKVVDIDKSRDLRFKFARTGKNAGESSAYRKIAYVEKDIMNLILPRFKKQNPQGVPTSGIQWEEVMDNTMLAYFNVWKKGKKRCENMEGPDSKWLNYEHDTLFVYLGPMGADLPSLKTGAMDDDHIYTSNYLGD